MTYHLVSMPALTFRTASTLPLRTNRQRIDQLFDQSLDPEVIWEFLWFEFTAKKTGVRPEQEQTRTVHFAKHVIRWPPMEAVRAHRKLKVQTMNWGMMQTPSGFTFKRKGNILP